jgi:ABC-2 type transport system ATP-binding protein
MFLSTIAVMSMKQKCQNMDNAIEVKELTKFFGSLSAVDHVNFEVRSREIFGLLGPNGAGKTTTIRMICGMLRPTSGTVVIAGFDISQKPQEVKRRIGLVPDISNLFGELSGRVNLEFMGKLYGLDKKTRKERIDQVLSLFQLKERQHSLVKFYSKGMHRRLTIAAALIHQPEILIMDEPTSGLDAQTARLVREIIRELNKEGRTVLLTTHQIDEADRLVDRVGIIDRGKLIALDTPEQLKNNIQSMRALEIRILNEVDQQRWIPLISKTEGVDKVVLAEGKIRILSKDLPQTIPTIVSLVAKQGGKIENISVAQPTLEDAFINLTGKSIREEPLSKEDSLQRRLVRSGLR